MPASTQGTLGALFFAPGAFSSPAAPRWECLWIVCGNGQIMNIRHVVCRAGLYLGLRAVFRGEVPMPLSDEERRRLEKLEQDLAATDPTWTSN